MQTPVRFSSCRGVAFEVKPHEHHFSISNSISPPHPTSSITAFWPCRSSFQIFPSPSSSILRSLSKPSSHFCDVDPLSDQEQEQLQALEEGDLQNQSTPQKPPSQAPKNPKSRLSIILLDQGLFTVYKRLFLLSLAFNITSFILAATGYFPYARANPALFSIGNIFALTLCRSEAFLRVLFSLAVTIFGRSWVPLAIKTTVTSLLQSLGGVHSGCGVSSIAWLVYALLLTLMDPQERSPAIVAVASAILALLSLSSLAAFPLVRHLHHNVFERTHRFAGWTALSLLWAFLILTLTYDPITKSYNEDLGSRLFQTQEFWFTAAITFLIILPWVTVRRVPVQISAPSGHASIIKFSGGVKPGLLGRISPSPLSEWHAFGIISDGEKEHMMLAGAVGDFTKSLVSDPPSHLWIRGVHFAGLPYLVNMYERALVVATGSGICVFLSFLLQTNRANVHLVWVAKGIEENFGKEIKEMVNGYPKEKVIVHDTAVLGRPNVAELTVKAARGWKAEVVIVTSNPEGSRNVVNACKCVGIAAFGPIWDS
ncbi:unnamed protein product [Citrullus colocynthis]|uniref:Uncharacterized protein n=1 Tax=Citrullus colocynthis TaxID=252529 RepID=A0ABP0YQP3_9ROSI